MMNNHNIYNELQKLWDVSSLPLDLPDDVLNSLQHNVDQNLNLITDWIKENFLSKQGEEITLGKEKIIIYTDGGCEPNPGTGAYAAIIIEDGIERIIKSEKIINTTNNQMELKAVIQALKSINSNKQIIIYSDSQYVVNSINFKWVDSWNKAPDFKGKKNRVLWLELLEIRKRFKNLKFIWIKGHSTNLMNNRVDAIVNSILF